MVGVIKGGWRRLVGWCLQGDGSRGAVRSQTRVGEGGLGREPKTELLGLDFARDIGNVGGGKWGEVDEWGLRGDGGCEVVGSQTRGGGGIGGRKLETEPLELDFGRAIEKNGSG
jgi:hypothetical protein